MEPRHVWRRLFALIVDYVLASAVAMALLWPFLGNTDRIRLGGAFEWNLQRCGTAQNVPQVLRDVIAPLRLDRVTVCETRAWGVPNGLTARLENIEVTGEGSTLTATLTRSAEVAITEDGLPVSPVYPQGPLALALFLLGSAAALSRGGTTPGKRLLGLRLSEVPDLRRALRREAWRVAPFLALAALGLAATPLGTDGQRLLLSLPVLALFAGPVAFWALCLWYYWPLLRWRGAMRHDAWTGLAVVRRRSPGAAAPG